MLTKAEVVRNDEIKVLAVAGACEAGDVPAFKKALYSPFAETWGPLLLQADGLSGLCPEGLAELANLARTLDSQGLELIIASTRPELFPGLTVMENRHLALGEILNRRSLRDEVVKATEGSTGIAVRPADADEDAARAVTFFKALGSLLLFTYEEPPALPPTPGDRLHFHVGLSPEEHEDDAAFEASVRRFAYVREGKTPCVVVDVPDVLNHVRRPARTDGLEVDLTCTYSDPHAMRATPKYGRIFALSAAGCAFKANAFDRKEGEEILVEIDFRTFRLSQPIRAEVQAIEYGGGEVTVTVSFGQLPGYDEQRLTDFIEDLAR